MMTHLYILYHDGPCLVSCENQEKQQPYSEFFLIIKTKTKKHNMPSSETEQVWLAHLSPPYKQMGQVPFVTHTICAQFMAVFCSWSEFRRLHVHILREMIANGTRGVGGTRSQEKKRGYGRQERLGLRPETGPGNEISSHFIRKTKTLQSSELTHNCNGRIPSCGMHNHPRWLDEHLLNYGNTGWNADSLTRCVRLPALDCEIQNRDGNV